MDHSGVSEVLYMGLSHKIGTPAEVTVRRDVLATHEMIVKPVQIFEGIRNTIGGSYREGFRFRSSDRDYMAWRCDHKVICGMSQSVFHHPSTDTLISMDTSHTPGGYARLQLLTPSRSPIINSSLRRIHNVNYISSSLFRSCWHHSLRGTDQARKEEIIHGPCYSFSFSSIETDLANCLYSPHWPTAALNSINRCLSRAWPSSSMLKQILSEGCHLVPIESKQPNDFEDLEWRISFAQAERKLIYCMNHVQFLCYGLLKIFLNETICDDLLCSYFMKTVLFWTIQNNCSMPWAPHSLLQHFWICYKFLMHSVYKGCLPNFFTPENNMLLGKVVGSQQISLFQMLEKLYKMGLFCLLQSPSIREILIPTLSALHLKSHMKSDLDIDIALQREMKKSKLDFICTDFQKIKIYLEAIENLSNFTQSANFQKAVAEVLISIGMSLKSKRSTRTKNKLNYQINRSIITMFTLVSKMGFASDILYLALYLYDSGRYQRASSVLAIAKQKLSPPHVMYNGEVHKQLYCELVGGQSLATKMRNAWARNVKLYSYFNYVEELKLEQGVSHKNGVDILHVPPLVLTHMLSVLCHHRLGNRSLCEQSLADLQTLLISNDEKNIPQTLRDVSWQILGICQHDVGDLRGALHSYGKALEQCRQLGGIMNAEILTAVLGDLPGMSQLLKSLKEIKLLNRIQEATERRIDSVCKQLSS